MKQVAGTLRLDLASYSEKQAFAQFGSDLDAATQYQLNHGAHMMELLKQGRYSALDVADQVIAIFAAKENFIDDIDLNHVTLFRDKLAKYMQDKHPSCRELVRQGKIDDALSERLKGHIAHFKEQFLLQHPNKAKQDDVERSAEPVVVAEDEDAGKAQE